MKKHKRHNRDKTPQVGINLIPGKGKIDYGAKANSPAQEAEAQAKAKADEARAKDQEAQVKAVLTLTTYDKGKTKATDSEGQTVLTKEDEAKIAKAKEAQVKAREARRQALEAQREAKEALEELNNGGSGAIKAMRQELEAKIKALEAKAEAMRDNLKAELDSLNSLYEEYKSLTGLDKAAKGNGKGKEKVANGNGRFTAAVKANGDQVKILVTHKESKALFETSLYPANGKIKADDWLALRHRFVAFFEDEKHKAKADKAISAKDYNLVLRAYLSNLKGKVEAIKPIV